MKAVIAILVLALAALAAAQYEEIVVDAPPCSSTGDPQLVVIFGSATCVTSTACNAQTMPFTVDCPTTNAPNSIPPTSLYEYDLGVARVGACSDAVRPEVLRFYWHNATASSANPNCIGGLGALNITIGGVPSSVLGLGSLMVDCGAQILHGYGTADCSGAASFAFNSTAPGCVDHIVMPGTTISIDLTCSSGPTSTPTETPSSASLFSVTIAAVAVAFLSFFKH